MFRRFARWLFGLLGFETDYEFYLPKQRQIYIYSNGTQRVHADPIILWQNLMEIEPGLKADLATAELPSKNAALCRDRALAAIRKLFNVKALEESGEGLTKDETLDLFDHFLIWSRRLGKAGSRFATFSRKSAESEPSSEEPLTTQSFSPSGLTENVSPTEQPTPPITEQASPSEPSSPEMISGNPIPMERLKQT